MKSVRVYEPTDRSAELRSSARESWNSAARARPRMPSRTCSMSRDIRWLGAAASRVTACGNCWLDSAKPAFRQASAVLKTCPDRANGGSGRWRSTSAWSRLLCIAGAGRAGCRRGNYEPRMGGGSCGQTRRKSNAFDAFAHSKSTVAAEENRRRILSRQRVGSTLKTRQRIHRVEGNDASFKYQEIYLRDYSTVADVEEGLRLYFEKYNHERPHQSLDNLTPAKVYEWGAEVKQRRRVDRCD